jgi:hypothetical protein
MTKNQQVICSFWGDVVQAPFIHGGRVLRRWHWPSSSHFSHQETSRKPSPLSSTTILQMIARVASLLAFLAAGNLASAFVAPSAPLTLKTSPSSTTTSLDVLARYRNNYYQDTDREYEVNNNRYYNNNDSYYGRGVTNNNRNSWYDGTSSNSLASQRDQYRYNQYGSTSVRNGRPYFNTNYSTGNYNSGYGSNYNNANSYDNYYYRPNSSSSYYNNNRNGYSVYNNNDYAADSMVDHELAKIQNKGRFAIENELYNTYGVSLSHETTKDELALYLLKCRLGQNPMGNNYNSRTRYNNGYGNGYNSGYGNGYGSYGNTGYNNKYSNSYSYRNGNNAGSWVDNSSDSYWRN